MHRVLFITLIAVIVPLFVAMPAYADIGVGVGTGKIDITEPIKAGGIYKLPPISVLNTGDETAIYSMHVTLNETQEELKPNPEWFWFSHQGFSLEPGKSQTVTPTFTPPISAPAGKYFAYLEAYPQSTVASGENTSIGVAAAAKLTFTVEDSSLLQGIINRAAALFRQHAPWTYLAAGLLITLLGWFILKKYLKFDIRISKI